MIKKENPKIIENNFINENLDNFNLYDNNIFFAFSIWSIKLNNNVLDESIYYPIAYYYFENSSKVERIPLKLEICKFENLPKYGNAQTYFKSKNISSYYCFEKNQYKNLSIFGKLEDDFYKSINIVIYKCENTTKNKCQSNENINNIFRNCFFLFFNLLTEIDPTNYYSPIKYYNNIKDIFLTQDYSLSLRVNLQFIDLITDYGFLLTHEDKKKIGKIELIETKEYFTKSNYIAGVIIEYSKKSKKIKRIYKKLPTILAEIGGIMNIIMIVMNLLNNPLVNLIFLNDFINSFFYIIINKEQLEKLEKECNVIKINKKKRKSKNIELNEENKINKIKINEYPNSMKSNFNKNYYYKIKSSFLELFGINFFTFLKNKNKEVKLKKNLLLKISEEINKKFNIHYIMQLLFEFENLKKVLLDENQLNLFEKIPKFVFNNIDKNNKLENLNNDKNLIELLKKENKTEIDRKIIELFRIKKK